MKVELAPTITAKRPNLFTRVKRFFVGKLETLKEDRFERRYCRLPKDEVITFRKDPNWCESADSTYRNNTIAERICYYPEDIEKMKSMTEDEAILFKRQLYKEGKIFYDDNYHVDAPELDAIAKEYGLDMNKYIIKDNK